VGNPSEYLLAVGMLGQFIALYCLWRMTVNLNRVLPPERRMSLSVREHWTEVPRLYKKSFPSSRIRTMWFLSGFLGVAALVLGTILSAINSK